MALSSFDKSVELNTFSQPRNPGVPEKIWMRHEKDIVHEICRGGFSYAHRWIESQNIPDFRPSYVILLTTIKGSKKPSKKAYLAVGLTLHQHKTGRISL
jgi:hypothetical protein